MKKLIFVFLLIILILFGCTEPDTVINKYYENETFRLGGEDIKIFPLDAEAAPLLAPLFIKIPTVTTLKAENDWHTGKMYAENSYSSADSVYQNTIHYLDVGSIVGIKKKLLVNVKFIRVAEGNNPGNPFIHIRAKGSTSAWKVFNPSLGIPIEELILTDKDGVLEWYADNGAPYLWNPNDDPGNEQYGWLDIEIYGDYYISTGVSF